MNSALKPVLASAGVPQPGGQSSPAKGNVASANHASVGHPQGAQNSLNHAGSSSNNLAVQNLTQHVPAPPQVPPHAVPSMAPVSANMAQMAQNMSNHGNLSHVNQNSVAGPPTPAVVVSPSKAPSTSSPLSLVAEKANPSQPLALTRALDKPEKKEPDLTGQANGTIDSPKTTSNAPVTLKAQNPEANKDKIDIAKTSPSTTKPPEKPCPTPSTPQKPGTSSPATVPAQPEVLTQPKVATASEPSEKSPSKPAEPKPVPIANVAPTQSDSKPVPESANSEPSPPEKDKAPAPAKQDPPTETPKPEPAKSEDKKEPEKPSTEEKPKEPVTKEKPEPPKKEDTVDAPLKVVEKEKVELKKVEPKKEPKPRSTLKLATVTPPLRKRRQVSPVKSTDGPSPAKKAAEGDSTPSDARTKRNRTKVQLYQSPTPELAMATKLSASAGRSTPTKPNDDKLIVFYKNEYLAVRNAEGGFYVCQTMQNVYRSTRKIKIRWLSQDKKADPSGETYKPDFYDVTDMECVLTTLSLSRAAGGAQLLRAPESARAASILQRALRAETTPGALQLTPEHPDGLDLSLYTDESQLEKRARKRAASKPAPSPRDKDTATHPLKEETTPVKKARQTPKRSPKASRKAKSTPAPAQTKTNNNKRKATGSTPLVAAAKTATAVVEKAKAAVRAAPKRTPAKPRAEPDVAPGPRKGRRAAAKEVKPSPALAQPSTSTGKTGRTRTSNRK